MTFSQLPPWACLQNGYATYANSAIGNGRVATSPGVHCGCLSACFSSCLGGACTST